MLSDHPITLKEERNITSALESNDFSKAKEAWTSTGITDEEWMKTTFAKYHIAADDSNPIQLRKKVLEDWDELNTMKKLQKFMYERGYRSEFEAISSTIAAAMAMSVNDVQQFFQNRLQNERDRLTESAQETGDSKQETQPSGGGSEEGSPSPVSGEKDKENSDNHKDILASLVKKTVKEDNARTAKAAKKKGAG